MASRKKKATHKSKQTRATKNESSKVSTNKPLETPLIYATDTVKVMGVSSATSAVRVAGAATGATFATLPKSAVDGIYQEVHMEKERAARA